MNTLFRVSYFNQTLDISRTLLHACYVLDVFLKKKKKKNARQLEFRNNKNLIPVPKTIKAFML